MRTRRLLSIVGVGAIALGACAGDRGVPELVDARIGEPAGPNAAMYFIASSERADRLIGAASDIAATIQIHETVVNDDGTLGMRQVQALQVSPGSPLVLQPGGLHLMLVDVDRLEAGSTVVVELEWEAAGVVPAEAVVVESGAAS